MRVYLDLSPEEVTEIQRVAKKSHRTVAQEVAWAVLIHIGANGFDDEHPPDGPDDDEHPF